MANRESDREADEEIGLDFDQLRLAGIAYLQALCGDVWTDHNLHDPGITILEQLCYALTDLTYRTEFDVADYLADADGEIDFQHQALYRPQEILSNQALTEDDYRKLFYDQIPQLSDVWVKAHSSETAPRHGLISVFAMLEEKIENAGFLDANKSSESSTNYLDMSDRVVQLIKLAYSSRRNLNEDLFEIRIVRAIPCYLQGFIEIEGERPSAEILAEILFACTRYLSNDLQVKRFSSLVAQGESPEAMFEGPFTLHGHVVSSKPKNSGHEVSATELISLVTHIHGVKRVRNLGFLNERGEVVQVLSRNLASGECSRLCFPTTEEQESYLQLLPAHSVVFGSPNRTYFDAAIRRDKNKALYAQARLEYAKLEYERQAFRKKNESQKKNESPTDVFPLPTGTYREFNTYYSIHEQFPSVYGINSYGVPPTAGNLRNAQAKQLKGYLFPFEQVMANYLQNLDNLPNLFSPELSEASTYSSQYLGNGQVPDIEGLYVTAPEHVSQILSKIIAKYDNFYERKSRVLDYLLALYGVEFPQTTLRRFDQCHRFDVDHWLLDLKAKLLRNLVDLSGHRAIAFDYMRKSGSKQQISRLQKRVSILLGFNGIEPELRPSQVFLSNGVTVISDEDFSVATNARDLTHSDLIFPLKHREAISTGSFELSFSICLTFFRLGVFENNYVVLHESNKYTVCYYSGQQIFFLKIFDRYEQASQWCWQLISYLTKLNTALESMALVEHILLRPNASGDADISIEHFNFFENRISIVFPSFGVRFNDPEFRSFAEETVRENCPAHLLPEFYWLDFDELTAFDLAHEQWCDDLRKSAMTQHLRGHRKSAQLDTSSTALMNILKKRSRLQNQRKAVTSLSVDNNREAT
ncbi:MAG: hypothetical protein K2Y28_03430 [Burkholderiaceae bacterium]|nr:hypothetical protein [Burkholderiaceae bacterium]